MPSSRIRSTATMLLLGALIAPAASAVGADSTSPRGRTPSPASYTARVADPTDDMVTEETYPDIEETLRKSDLGAVVHKTNVARERLVVTYVVPEVHHDPEVAQVFRTVYLRPSKKELAPSQRRLGSISTTLYARGDARGDGPAYSRAFLMDGPGGLSECRRARATIDRDPEATDRVIVSVPLACLGLRALRPGTTAQSFSRVDDPYGDYLAWDSTRSVVVVPRQ